MAATIKGIEIAKNDVVNTKLNSKNLIDLFILTVIKLKTDINYQYQKINQSKDKFNHVEIGKYDIHAYVLTMSLRLFIDKYASNESSDIVNYVNNNLLKKKDELYFTNFNVQLDTTDYEKAINILDALCVKFYQELILILTSYFATTKQQVFIIQSSNETNMYRFSYRDMNIAEKDAFFSTGKFPINKVN